jgi:PmbA protein
MACKKADSAEVYFMSSEEHDIRFENHLLIDIGNRVQSGYCLRLIKDGFIGTSYTKNLTDREALLERALESLIGGIHAGFSFPVSRLPGDLKSYDQKIRELTSQEVINGLKKISDYFRENSYGQLNIDAGYGSNHIRIINSNGQDVTHRSSLYYTCPMILFPNSYASIKYLFFSTGFNEIPEVKFDTMRFLFSKARPEVSPKSGSTRVIFSPHTLFTLMWRISEAASAKSVFENISPIKDRVGQRIFSEELAIKDNPRIVGDPFARSFDDEGTLTSKFTLIERGVLKGFFNNLDYADKLKTGPTGHGYKSDMWGGEAITLSPMPKLSNLHIEPGSSSFEDMIAGVNRGVLVMGALGAHSGNIVNGDFSIGLNPGLYIENGEITGRIKNGMVAGNIYDIMKRVSSIEDKVHQTKGGNFPYICFDDVKFSSTGVK